MNINKKGTTDKNKIFWFGGVIGVVAVAIIAGTMYFNMDKDQLQLSNNVFTVELGNEISLKPSTYLKAESKSEVVKNAVVSIKLMNNEKYTVNEEKQTITTKDKEYLGVGKYDFTMKYKEEKKSFVVEVEDTTKPTFVDFKDEIEVEVNSDTNIATLFKAKDLSEVTIALEDVDKKAPLDRAREGDYKINVVASDKYKNKVKKECVVKVIAKAVEVPAEQSNTNTEVNTPVTSGSGNTSAGGSTNNGGSSTGGGATPPANVCVSDGNFGRIGNSGKVFYSKAEADSWAENYILSQGDIWAYSGWYAWTVYDNCGERKDVWSVDFY